MIELIMETVLKSSILLCVLAIAGANALAAPGSRFDVAVTVDDLPSHGAKPADIPVLLQGNVYPLAADQANALGAPTTQALTDTATFLKQQGKVDAVLPDYSPYVSAKYLPN